MRRLLKSFTAFSVIAMLLFSFCISVGAVEETHNSQDGLVASITTKKDSYQSNEDIDLTFKVTNTNDFTVENVSLEAILPENFEVKDNKKQNVDYVSLKSGESITLDIVAIKVNNTATKPDNTKATATSKSNIEETTKILIPDVQAVTSATDGVSKNSVLATQNSSVKSEESVKTGNNMAVFLVVSICIASFAVIIVLKNRKNVRRYLSIVLCFSIISGVVTVGGISMVNAAEMEQKSFTVNKEINVSENNYTISGVITYNSFDSEEDNITRAEWADMLVREFSMNTELGQNVKVPYNDIESSKYKDSIVVAYYYGILLTDVDEYNPDGYVTREFATYTLNNCLGFVNNETLVCDDIKELKYPEASAAMVERGFFNLVDNKFVSEKAVTRSELNNIVVLIKKTLDKAKIDTNYDNTVKIEDSVISFDGSQVKSINNNVVTLKLDDETSSLKEGDVFVTQNPNNLNETVAYKINKTEVSDGKVILDVTEPEMYELYDKLDIQGKIPSGMTDLKKSKKSDNSVSAGFFNKESIDIQDTIELDANKLKFVNKEFKIGDVANPIKIKLNGSLDTPELEYKIYTEKDTNLFSLNPLHIKDNFVFYIALKDKLKFSGTAQISGGIGKEGTVEIAKCPVRILPTIGVNVIVNLTVKADGSITFECSVENKVGVLWDKTGLEFIKDFSKPEIKAEASVNATVGIGPAVELTCATITIGAKSDIGAKAKLSVGLTRKKDNLFHGDMSSYFYFNAGVYVDDSLKGILEIFNIPTKKNFEIVNEENSPLKISTHMEGDTDIRFMDKCSYRYVKGTVVDSETSNPIRDAKVEIYSENAETPFATVMTNESGEFESLIDDVDGYFVFKISKDGYKGLKFNLTPTNIRRGEDTHMGKCKLVVSSSSESEDKIYYSNVIQKYKDKVYYSSSEGSHEGMNRPRLDFSKVKPDYIKLPVKANGGVQSFIIYNNKIYYLCNYTATTGTKGNYTSGELYRSDLDGKNVKLISSDVTNECMELSKGKLYFNTGRNYDEIIYNSYDIANDSITKINDYQSVGKFQLGWLFRYEQSIGQYMEFDGGLYYYAREGILEIINGEHANVYYYRKDKSTGKVCRVGYSYDQTIATDSYKDKLIDELLEHESEWFVNQGATVGYHSALTFKDLNFDGRPEFIMECGGGSMRNNPANVYYYSNNKLQKANGSFQANIKGYYIKQTGEYRILGTSFCRITEEDWWLGNYILSFTGTDVSEDYYSSYTSERNLGMKYYRYADSYGESKGCEEITKDEYDLINSQQLKGLVDINMTSDTVWSEDWVKLSQTEKRTTLEKLYDSFTYDKY